VEILNEIFINYQLVMRIFSVIFIKTKVWELPTHSFN